MTSEPIHGDPDDPDPAVRVLLDHPWIARVERISTGGILVTADPATLAVRPKLGALVAEHLEHWTEVYDFTYSSAAGDREPGLDLAGWRATDSGLPLADGHMSEWADRTIEVVLRNRPSWVLELGCGTGMMLHRLHPHVSGYVGIDVSERAVERLSQQNLAGVRLIRVAAHEIAGPDIREALESLAGAGGGPRRPDCILLNSVTQCFPSVEYLSEVVGAALDLVAPGGAVVLGDVRHAGLLDHYCRWAESSIDATLEEPELTNRAQRRAAADRELLLDAPTLAVVAAGTHRQVTISLLAKTLTADTELTRYRFDAVLHVDATAAPASTVHDWAELGPEPMVALSQLAGGVEPLQVHEIPNELLDPRPGSTTGAALRAAVSGCVAVVLIDPADPTRLQVAAPAEAAAVPPEALAGTGRPHEPLEAFARTRLVEVSRDLLRRAGLPASVDLVAQLPSGAGRAAASQATETAAADRAGRVLLGTGGEPVPDSMLERLPSATRRFDEIALQALSTLMTTSGALDADRWRTPEQIVDVLSAAPRHCWIVRRWLSVLHAEGRAQRDPDGRYRLVVVEPRPELEPTGPTLRRACTALGYPPEMVAFFRDAIAHLPQLLRDEIPAQALLFPDGDMLTSLSKDERNVSNTYLNGALGRVLRTAAGTRAAPLRVVELGAGAGGTTAAALRGLGDAPVDYHFTDVSRFFTLAAKDRFGPGPGLRYGLLDINRDLVDQGAVPGGADVVIAANVLHCALHIGRSLRWIRELLAPGGLLIVTEASREHYLVLTTMQFLLSPRPGQPHPGSEDRRGGTGRVFLVERELPAELAEAGLRPVLELPSSDSPLAAPAQHLYVAVRS